MRCIAIDARWNFSAASSKCGYLSPVECMDACIHYKACGSEDFLVEVAKPDHTILVYWLKGIY